MLEPASVGAAIDPEGSIFLLEPHRDHLDAPVFAVGPDDRRKDLLGKRLHFRTELDRHHTTSHLKSRVASRNHAYVRDIIAAAGVRPQPSDRSRTDRACHGSASRRASTSVTGVVAAT